jgi:hypothetical protein
MTRAFIAYYMHLFLSIIKFIYFKICLNVFKTHTHTDIKDVIRDELGLDNIDIRFNWSPHNMTVLFNSLINLIEVNKSDLFYFYFYYIVYFSLILYCI